MAANEPVTELHAGFSKDGATPTAWAEARAGLEKAEVSWLSTVRPDGRPHVTPLLTVWSNGALHFCTGPTERKAKNLEQNPHCVLTTGCNALHHGVDLVVEGDAARVTDEADLRHLTQAFESKYGSEWRFQVDDNAGTGAKALVYRVAPSTAFGFAKGEFSQTRWRFEQTEATAAATSSTVVVVGQAPEKMREAAAVLEASGFTVIGVFDEAEALRAIADHEILLAVVAGGSVSAETRERLRAAAAPNGAVIIDANIGHSDPADHFRSKVLPHLIAARTQTQRRQR